MAGLSDDDRAAIAGIPLFDGLPADAVAAFTADARPMRCEARTLLFSRGDRADGFYLLLAGRVRLFVLTAEGRESVIETVEPGQSFAEAAMFGTCTAPVNAEAEAGSRLIRVPARPILARVDTDPATARAMMDSLARWQRHLIGRVGGFKARAPGQRLAVELLSLTDVAEGAATVRLETTKAGLAAHIGITPESLSRAMARLRAFGVVCKGRQIVIDDVAALRRYAEDRDDEALP